MKPAASWKRDVPRVDRHSCSGGCSCLLMLSVISLTSSDFVALGHILHQTRLGAYLVWCPHSPQCLELNTEAVNSFGDSDADSRLFGKP